MGKGAFCPAFRIVLAHEMLFPVHPVLTNEGAPVWDLLSDIHAAQWEMMEN